MAHNHNVSDTDIRFKIDGSKRAVTNILDVKKMLVKNDHNSERFGFELPRFIDGHDMLKCDIIEIHYDNIGTDEISKGVYKVVDAAVSPANPETIVFSWLVSRNATKLVGKLEFNIHFKCNVDGQLEYCWSTLPYKNITIEPTIDNSDVIITEENQDIISQWQAELFGIGNTQEQRLLTISAQEQNAIEIKGNEVKESLPGEYSEIVSDISNVGDSSSIVCESFGSVISIKDASNRELKNLVLYGKTIQNGVPSVDNPVALKSANSDGVVNVNIYGKNLLEFNGPVIIPKELYAYQVTSGDLFNAILKLPKNTPVTFSSVVINPGTAPSSVTNGIAIGYKDNSLLSLYYNGSAVIDGSKEIASIIIYAGAGKTIDATMTNIQIELGKTKTEYEPGKLVQSIAISIPNAFRGIPVDVGGTYTDNNGQQWICDEINFGRKVYVQRIGYIKSYLAEEINTPYMSSTGELSEGAMVIYVLDEPIETPLTEQEIESINNLHSNYLDTVVANNSNIDMKAQYVADTKTYIDNKFAELRQAIEDKTW